LRKKLILTAMAMVLLLGLLAGTGVTADDDYAWVLVEKQYYDNQMRLDDEYSNAALGEREWSHNNRNYYYDHSEQRVELRKGGVRRNTSFPYMDIHTIYSWNSPPDVVRAGETASFTVDLEVRGNEPGGLFTTHGWIGPEGGYGGFRMTEPGEAKGAYILHTGLPTGDLSAPPTSRISDSTYLLQESGTVVFTWDQFLWGREGSPGDQRNIEVRVTDGGSQLGVYENYIYEWKKVSTADPAPDPEPVPEPVPQTGAFSDLSPSHWAYNDIMDMVEMGILSGYPDGTFRPNNVVTRAEFAKIMVQALELSTTRPRSATFADVGPDHWAFEDVESARDYLTGYYNPRTGEMSFLPSNDAVREDVAVAIVKAQGYGDETADLSLLNQFPDQGEISDALQEHVAIAVEKEYMQGTNIGFEPQKALTRAEACTLLLRIIHAELEKVTI